MSDSLSFQDFTETLEYHFPGEGKIAPKTQENFHFCRFFFPLFPEELWELEVMDRHTLFLADMVKIFGKDFQYDPSGKYAYLDYSIAPLGRRVLQAIDMSQDAIWTVCFFGAREDCLAMDKYWALHPQMRKLDFPSQLLIDIAQQTESILRFQHRFKQLKGVGQTCHFEGIINGELAHQMFDELRKKSPIVFNLFNFTGYGFEGISEAFHFENSGSITEQKGDRSSLLKITAVIKTRLTEIYERICANYLTQWETDEQFPGLQFRGGPLEINLEKSIERTDIFVRQIVSGQKPFFLVGPAEKVSNQLWRIWATSLENGDQIELEIAPKLIRIYIKTILSIPLAWKVEHLLQQTVSANLKGLLHD